MWSNVDTDIETQTKQNSFVVKFANNQAKIKQDPEWVYSKRIPELVFSLKNHLAVKQLSMRAPVHVVQLHMKIGTADLAKHIKEIKVRAHVVLKLGYDLIRAGHAAYVEVKFFSHGDIYLDLNLSS